MVAVPLSGVVLAAGMASLFFAGRPLTGAATVSGSVASLHLPQLAVPSRVYDSEGKFLGYLSDGQFREPVPLSSIPHVVINAVLDVEDNTFYQTGPIDLRGVIRALKADVTTGHIVEGGSTITQQLVKQDLLNSRRTIGRKLQEAVLSIRLTQQLSKRQILQDYLNTVYFGDGAYGVEAAAHVFFNKEVRALDAAQAALLASMIENPTAYSPFLHPKASLQRRNIALAQMVKNHSLTHSQEIAAQSEPLPKAPQPFQALPLSAFMVSMEQSLLASPALGATVADRERAIFEGGLRITTTLNPTLESDAKAAVAQDLPNTNNRYTAALVAMDPSNGEVRALVSGNPVSPTGYDVATGYGASGRQAGSSFKPFTLMAALESGYSPYDLVDGTAPCTFDLPHTLKAYVAHNAEPGYGVMTVVKATADSVNCAYLRLGIEVGVPKVRAMAKTMGVTTPIPDVPSIIIGAAGVTPLEMADAYSVLDDGGMLHSPRFVEKVVNPSGKVLIGAPGKGHRVVPSNYAAITDQVLQQVVISGTGVAAALPGREVAGKTGTTDHETDAWFDGFTPQLVTSVWMGDPASEAASMSDVNGIVVYGGTYPAEIWHTFMSAALAGQPAESFPQPDLSVLPPPRYVYPSYAPGTIPPSQVNVSALSQNGKSGQSSQNGQSTSSTSKSSSGNPTGTTTTTTTPSSTTTTTAPSSTTTTTSPSSTTTTTTTSGPTTTAPTSTTTTVTSPGAKIVAPGP